MTEYKRTFKSDRDLLPEIETYILDIVDTLNITDLKRNDIEMVVAEASANSVLHGNKNDHSKDVIVKINIDDNTLQLSFTDEGTGFKPEDIPDPTIPENILKGSGRGLHIMRELVDNMEYKFSKKGTELILTFNI